MHKNGTNLVSGFIDKVKKSTNTDLFTYIGSNYVFDHVVNKKYIPTADFKCIIILYKIISKVILVIVTQFRLHFVRSLFFLYNYYLVIFINQFILCVSCKANN